MSRPDPDAFESPPSTTLTRSAIDIEACLDTGPARDCYAGTVSIEDQEWEIRLLEPRLQGLDTRGPHEAVERRFEGWARADGHPLIAAVVDWGIDAGVPWLVTEAVAGPTLAARFADAPIDPAEAVWIARNCCGVVAHARGECPGGVTITPERVLCRVDSDAWHLPLVTEVGLDLDAVATARGVDLPWYVAPERFRPALDGSGDSVDIYRIASICYRLLTGTCPYNCDPLDRDPGQTPRPPTDLRPALPAVADTVLCDALAIDPAERPWTVADLETGLATIAQSLGKN